MKSAQKNLLPLWAIILVCFACQNDDGNNESDCKLKNYGVWTVNFGSNDVKHGILVTASDGSFRDKTVNAGSSRDTIHLKPDTYTIEVSSLNEDDLALESEDLVVSIGQCDQKTKNVDF